jgi:hypothetical protein
MANSRSRADHDRVDLSADTPAVHCIACQYEWHTQVMAEGLRLLGTCPKCGGELEFAADQPAHEASRSPKMDLRAPHLVLGVPRR